MPGAPYRAWDAQPAGRYQLSVVRHARGSYQSLLAGGREEAVPPARGGWSSVPKARRVVVMAQRSAQVSRCRREVGPRGDSDATTRHSGPSEGPLSSPALTFSPMSEGARPRPRPQRRNPRGVRAPPSARSVQLWVVTIGLTVAGRVCLPVADDL